MIRVSNLLAEFWEFCVNKVIVYMQSKNTQCEPKIKFAVYWDKYFILFSESITWTLALLKKMIRGRQREIGRSLAAGLLPSSHPCSLSFLVKNRSSFYYSIKISTQKGTDCVINMQKAEAKPTREREGAVRLAACHGVPRRVLRLMLWMWINNAAISYRNPILFETNWNWDCSGKVRLLFYTHHFNNM